MSFKSVLENITGRLEGVLGVMVIAEDGIIVERMESEGEFDTDLASVEFLGGCKSIRAATEAIAAGALSEITVISEKATILLRSISPGYYLLLMLGPGVAPGKPRFLLKKASYELATEFL